MRSRNKQAWSRIRKNSMLCTLWVVWQSDCPAETCSQQSCSRWDWVISMWEELIPHPAQYYSWSFFLSPTSQATLLGTAPIITGYVGTNRNLVPTQLEQRPEAQSFNCDGGAEWTHWNGGPEMKVGKVRRALHPFSSGLMSTNQHLSHSWQYWLVNRTLVCQGSNVHIHAYELPKSEING